MDAQPESIAEYVEAAVEAERRKRTMSVSDDDFDEDTVPKFLHRGRHRVAIAEHVTK